MDFTQGIAIAQLLSSAFLAILFIQSGLDKVFDWKGNLSWLKKHFAKTPLRGMVPAMLGTMTIFEVAAGFVSAAGVISLLVKGDPFISLLGAYLSALSILMLFGGQRIAKDYEGAATLVSYFILAIGTIILLSMA